MPITSKKLLHTSRAAFSIISPIPAGSPTGDGLSNPQGWRDSDRTKWSLP